MFEYTDHGVRVREELATVWTGADYRPARLFFGGSRWRVEGVPTPIVEEAEDVHPMLTHPPLRRVGWACVARREGGKHDSAELELRPAGATWVVRVMGS